VRTAGQVMCRPEECRNFGCGRILESLFCRDPHYERLKHVPKHVQKKLTSFSGITTTDWGNKASHRRDTDALKMNAILEAILQDNMANMPVLFDGPPFTTEQITACLGSKSMSENARKWFEGEWLQHQVEDGMSRLTGAAGLVLALEDRLADNKNYAPYGRTEIRPREEPASDKPAAGSPGSTSTVSDDGALESPSLSTHWLLMLCVRNHV